MKPSEYMGAVAAIGCYFCRMPAEVHHKRSGQGQRRASDYDTMPLCPEHHRLGSEAFHVLGTKGFVKHHGITEDEIIEDTRRRLGFSSEQVEVWKQEDRAKRRNISKPARGKKTPATTKPASKWPSRKLASRSSFRAS